MSLLQEGLACVESVFGLKVLVEQVESSAHANSRDAVRFVDDNIEVLLSKDMADEVDGTDLAALFEVALGTDGGDGVFETIVFAVAEEGVIHSPELRPVLGEAAGARLAWFDARINAFTSDNSDEWDRLRVAYDAAFTFLRETMRDQAVAERLRRSMVDYRRTEVAAALHAGDERTTGLMNAGSSQAFFTLAYFKAEEREARIDRNIDAVEAAREAHLERRREDAVDRAMWVALDRFESDPAVRAAAVGEPFAEASGSLKNDLTGSEANALKTWATNQAREGGLLAGDATHLAAGAQIVYDG